jgi:hypothetical protein
VVCGDSVSGRALIEGRGFNHFLHRNERIEFTRIPRGYPSRMQGIT